MTVLVMLCIAGFLVSVVWGQRLGFYVVGLPLAILGVAAHHVNSWKPGENSRLSQSHVRGIKAARAVAGMVIWVISIVGIVWGVLIAFGSLVGTAR